MHTTSTKELFLALPGCSFPRCDQCITWAVRLGNLAAARRIRWRQNHNSSHPQMFYILHPFKEECTFWGFHSRFIGSEYLFCLKEKEYILVSIGVLVSDTGKFLLSNLLSTFQEVKKYCMMIFQCLSLNIKEIARDILVLWNWFYTWSALF